jgi:hypothetical protein
MADKLLLKKASIKINPKNAGFRVGTGVFICRLLTSLAARKDR